MEHQNSQSSVLHALISSNDETGFLANLLQNSNSDINQIDTVSGFAPIHSAISAQNSEFLQRLIEIGADVNLPARNGQTPLTISIQNNDLTCSNTLIYYKADVNGDTKSCPLMLAILADNNAIFKNLVCAGASVSKKVKISNENECNFI